MNYPKFDIRINDQKESSRILVEDYPSCCEILDSMNYEDFFCSTIIVFFVETGKILYFKRFGTEKADRNAMKYERLEST